MDDKPRAYAPALFEVDAESVKWTIGNHKYVHWFRMAGAKWNKYGQSPQILLFYKTGALAIC